MGLAVHDVFEQMGQLASEGRSFSVRVAYLEIYNEQASKPPAASRATSSQPAGRGLWQQQQQL